MKCNRNKKSAVLDLPCDRDVPVSATWPSAVVTSAATAPEVAARIAQEGCSLVQFGLTTAIDDDAA